MEGKSIDLSAIEPDTLYRPEQAGPFIGKSGKSLANLRCERKGPAYVKLGPTVFYRGRDLLAYIEAARVDPLQPLRLRRRRGATIAGAA